MRYEGTTFDCLALLIAGWLQEVAPCRRHSHRILLRGIRHALFCHSWSRSAIGRLLCSVRVVSGYHDHAEDDGDSYDGYAFLAQNVPPAKRRLPQRNECLVTWHCSREIETWSEVQGDVCRQGTVTFCLKPFRHLVRVTKKGSQPNHTTFYPGAFHLIPMSG